MQAPPTALILFSAIREKNLALTMTGCLGKAPLPKTLKKPARVQSITGAFLVSFSYLTRVCSDTKVHSLSKLMEGLKNENDHLLSRKISANFSNLLPILKRIVGVNVEITHANLSEVTGMVLVKVDTVMMLATSVTATSGMLPVLADTAMTMGDMATHLPGLLFVGAHCGWKY